MVSQSYQSRNQSYYTETKLSWLVIVLCFFATVAVVGFALSSEISITHILLFFLITFIEINFFLLKIEINGSELYYSYGIGLFSNTIGASGINYCEVKPNSYFKSWIYNPRAENCLLITLRGGIKTSLPTNNPKIVLEKLKLR